MYLKSYNMRFLRIILFTSVIFSFNNSCSITKFNRNASATNKFECGLKAINEEIVYAKEEAMIAAKKNFGDIADSFKMIAKIHCWLCDSAKKEEFENNVFFDNIEIEVSHRRKAIGNVVIMLDLLNQKGYMYDYSNNYFYRYEYSSNENSDWNIPNQEYYFFKELLNYQAKALLPKDHYPSLLLTEKDELLFIDGNYRKPLEFYSVDEYIEKRNYFYRTIEVYFGVHCSCH